MRGTNVCKYHGGKSLRNIGNKNYINGYTSKDFIMAKMPKALREKYDVAIADDDLIVLRKDIALLEARIWQLVEKIEEQESGKTWFMARDAYREMRAAMDGHDEVALKAALFELDNAIRKGARDYMVWQEIQQVMEQKRKLTVDERKRLVDLKQMMTIEQTMLLIQKLANLVKANVTDDTALRNISEGLTSLVWGSLPAPSRLSLPVYDEQELIDAQGS